MAEEAPVVQNWRVLVVAIVLGLIVAVIYNVHVAQIRTKVAGEQVLVLQVQKDLVPNEVLKGDVIEKVQMPKSVAERLDSPMYGDSYDYALTQTVNTSLKKGHYLTWADVTKEADAKRPSNGLTPGMRAFAVQVDPRLTPNEMLRIGDHVDLSGVFTIDGKTSYLPIIDGVKVIEIGGHTAKDTTARGAAANEGWSSFRSISIEISPTVYLSLSNVLSHATGVRVILRNPVDETTGIPQLSTQVKTLTGSAFGGTVGKTD